ncbi:hypothetical protein GRF29_19g845043 [Pseudopithomyces chartarum]|uniref:MYND-type domain-containing protein n=1 Tax=Pseudopithomyces chartarum TaxID=1892770 RepID=A0AAN6M3M5_9PLEO|nr:hypothetical protein GRF29_19g845043 [Pseudopithomyces chartarum]
MNVTAMTSSVGGAVDPFFSATFPTICSTCTRPPPSGHSLLRCSRCKRAYYCSRTCQKQAWKGHKLDCDPISDRTSPSALHTPDASVPGSPAQTTDDQEFTLGSPINRDAISLCGAMHDSVYTTATTTN